MRRQGWSVLALVVVTLPLCGQDQSKANYSSPKFELFAGYSLRTTRMFKEPAYYPAIYPPYLSPLLLRRENAHGWGLGFTYKFHDHIGVTADLSGQHGRMLGPIITSYRHNFASYQFLFGPTFSLRSGRITEFAHTMAGAFYSAGGNPRTDFAMAYGGGVDVRVSDLISVRAFQADWIPVKHGAWEHHVRFQTGIIFNLGR